MNNQHEHFLRQAIAIAQQGLDSGNPPFGSIIVVDGVIRGSAFNTSKTEDNFLAHGEMNLLSKTLKSLSAEELSRAIIYATNEPCPMCSGAIYWSGVRQLVYGSSRDALTKLRAFGLNVPCRAILERGSEPMSVIGPMLEEEIMPLYETFYRG